MGSKDGLDASYALLSDVNARNRELQAKLRSSLPLLWMDKALVMNSAAAAAPRRRRVVEQADSETDQMLLALEGRNSLQVSRRYKRRVEWEVARRIARVDRELQQYPPAQRFWNQRRKDLQSSTYRQRVNGVKRAEVREKLVEKRNEGGRQKKVVEKTTGGEKRKLWVKPKVVTKILDGEQRAMKHTATSPLRFEVGDVEDKENAVLNGVTRTRFEAKKAPSWEDSRTIKKVTGEQWDDLPVLDDEAEDTKSEESVEVVEKISNTVSSGPVEIKSDSPGKKVNSPVGSAFKKKEQAASNVHQDIEGDDKFEIEEDSPRKVNTPGEERPSSSIGRQVLSEFRTMPSVASFGAQPMFSASGLGKPGDMRLNPDVLRRLFSDLDTDKDGHVNRIETCMALHRLQISVPTTKIISFFRHIHSSGGRKSVRSRNKQHAPMMEVINYKEFVAFVTAAYDQQQQKKVQRNRTPTRRNVWKEDSDRIPSVPAPSTSLPIYEDPTRSPKVNRPIRSPLVGEQQVRAYEVEDPTSEQGGATIEEKVIKEIPDFLVSRIFADAPNVKPKQKTVSVVRKSLKSLVGKQAIDDKIVNEITQELIKERLRNLGAENIEDVTGLRRAEAYYNKQLAEGDAEFGFVVEDLNSEDVVNWVDVLTEEQVSGLVQQIWKDRRAGRHHASLELAENVQLEDIVEVSEEQTVKWTDQATDTNELSVVPSSSEKAIEVCDADFQEEPSCIPADGAPGEIQEDVVVSSPTGEPISTRFPHTHFARALANSLGGNGNGSHDFFTTVTSIQILQQLRQQRRMHQIMANVQRVPSPSDEVVKSHQESSTSNRGNALYVDLMDSESIISSDESAASQCVPSRPIHKAESQIEMPLPTTEPVVLTEKTLEVDDFESITNSFERSVSVSSSDFSSTSGNPHIYGMYREIDHHQLQARSLRYRRTRQRRKHLSVSGSSVPDSMCSAELSEGELSREEALDFSDGEIFGECKRKYARRYKYDTSNVLESKGGGDNLDSSVESGEVPALMKAHANFRRQLVAQSPSSSVESGELEDGSLPD